jgi:5-methylcytosine-specific restriction endonuclease McrA
MEGCTSTDLTVDHIDPRTRGKAGLTLADVQVLCRLHNSSKGAKSYRLEGSSTAEEIVAWVR